MKNLKGFLLIAIFSFIALSGFSQETVVATDQNYEKAEFDKYSSFTFASHIEDETDATYFMENKTMKDILKEEIKGELEALGYTYMSGSDKDADLMVNFQVLDEKTEFTGWLNDVADATYWGDMNLVGQEREEDEKTTYILDKGSIMIHMADIDKGIAVWRGYASGIVEQTELTNKDEVRIDEAVEQIFDEFDYTASR